MTDGDPLLPCPGGAGLLGINGLPGVPGLPGPKGLPVCILSPCAVQKPMTLASRVFLDHPAVPASQADAVNQAHQVYPAYLAGKERSAMQVRRRCRSFSMH